MLSPETQIERAVIDVRHTTNDETVQCMGKHLNSVWSKYVVDVESRALGLSGKMRLYLCRKCLAESLLLAEGLEAE